MQSTLGQRATSIRRRFVFDSLLPKSEKWPIKNLSKFRITKVHTAIKGFPNRLSASKTSTHTNKKKITNDGAYSLPHKKKH